MNKKLKILFKTAVVVSVFWAAFVLFFLQEVAVFGDSFLKACEENGVSLPLEEPSILVDVSDSTLTISESGVVVRRYDISTGSNRLLGALRRDLKSTPVGEYRVIHKSKRDSVLVRGSRFLQINFPSELDIENAWEQGLITRAQYQAYFDNQEPGCDPPQNLAISRVLGIQGNYFAIVGPRSTNGGVALSNGDINDIFDHIPIGTPVVIRP